MAICGERLRVIGLAGHQAVRDELRATEQLVDTATAAGKAFLDMLGVFAVSTDQGGCVGSRVAMFDDLGLSREARGHAAQPYASTNLRAWAASIS